MVNYTAVAEMKLKMLRLVHSYFKAAAGTERKRALQAFAQRGGESLRQFCAFQAMRLENDGNAAGHPLDGLPAADSPRFIEFAVSRQEQIEFLIWAQWMADSQLSEAARHAEANGIRLGLYRDLAVGSSASGAEVWSNPDTVVRQAHAGAPPDIVNPAGQDWNLPPFHPRALREAAYAPFIELVRANMRYSGALRIDHAIGLQHLYWVPAGQKPDHGAYVTYPFDDLVGILALESQRNHCLIIGEDLGTVPAGFSRKLNERGILSNRVLHFEQDPEFGRFSLPEEYPSLALASIATHDLATLKGWWLGDDIAIREEHHLYPDPLEAERQRGIRQKEKRNLLAALRLEGLEPREDNEFNSLCRAVYSFLARSHAAIVMLELENLTGEKSQTNLPGSVTYPNWRRRYTKSLEELSQDPDVIAVIEAVDRERPRSRV
jgi:4-alpha-glucanotransferase